ncbi:hypothetical protein FEP59_01127 [Burkholderia multivorans]|nr:hypothetical protein [Burkholderia multivorans]
MTSALARLKSMRTGARGLGKLFQGKRYLYELPWYITLGSQGSGKTSILMNGGLAFPVAEQMQRAAAKPAADAAAVDWWLTNDAVLIDTTGYYTRHGMSTAEAADTRVAEQDKPAADVADKDAANAQASPERSADGTQHGAPAKSEATAARSRASMSYRVLPTGATFRSRSIARNGSAFSAYCAETALVRRSTAHC